jgi:hypothetical protein
MVTYRMPDWLREEFPDMPVPPPLTTNAQKLCQFLPLPLYLVVCFLWIQVQLVGTLLAYVVDGPIKSSWSSSTALLHSLLKSNMQVFCPQGRHSMMVVRALTSISVPRWTFRTSEITPFEFAVRKADKLSELMHNLVQMIPNPKHLLKDERTLRGEFIRDQSNALSNTAVLFLHGG